MCDVMLFRFIRKENGRKSVVGSEPWSVQLDILYRVLLLGWEWSWNWTYTRPVLAISWSTIVNRDGFSNCMVIGQPEFIIDGVSTRRLSTRRETIITVILVDDWGHHYHARSFESKMGKVLRTCGWMSNWALHTHPVELIIHHEHCFSASPGYLLTENV